MSSLDDVHAAVLRAVPRMRNLILAAGPCAHVESEPIPGRVLLEPDWLAVRIADTERLWNCDTRVATTLWWYSASSTLVATGAAALLVDGRAPDPRPERLTMTMRHVTGYIGYPARTRSDQLLDGGPEEYGIGLRDGLAQVIAALAEVGGTNPRSLWSILTDSLAGRLLETAERLGGPAPDGLLGIAQAMRGGDLRLPMPRYRGEQVRRGSCCLFYLVPGEGKCGNCPRQPSVHRAASSAPAT